MSQNTENENPLRKPTKKAPFAEAVSTIRHEITDHPKRNLGILAAGASISAGLYGLSTLGEGGNEHLPPTFELTESQQHLVLSEGAIIRLDPVVTDENDRPNDILHLDHQIDVISLGFIPDTNDGTWYVVTGDSLRDGLAGTASESIVEQIKNDNDNRLFINEQGVVSADPIEAQVAETDD